MKKDAQVTEEQLKALSEKQARSIDDAILEIRRVLGAAAERNEEAKLSKTPDGRDQFVFGSKVLFIERTSDEPPGLDLDTGTGRVAKIRPYDNGDAIVLTAHRWERWDGTIVEFIEALLKEMGALRV